MHTTTSAVCYKTRSPWPAFGWISWVVLLLSQTPSQCMQPIPPGSLATFTNWHTFKKSTYGLVFRVTLISWLPEAWTYSNFITAVILLPINLVIVAYLCENRQLVGVLLSCTNVLAFIRDKLHPVTVPQLVVYLFIMPEILAQNLAEYFQILKAIQMLLSLEA